MIDNPYNAPLPHAAGDVDLDGRPLIRPLSVAVLAGILWIRGSLQMHSHLMAYWHLSTNKETSIFLGPPLALLLAVMLLFSILMIVAGIGAWNGSKWAWWYSYICCILGVILNGLPLIAIAESFEPAAREWRAALLHSSVRVLVYCLLFWLLYRRDLRKYFGLKTRSRERPAVC